MSVTLADFQPLNTWTVDTQGACFEDKEPQWIIDQTTGRKYLNDSAGIVWFKCALLAIGTLPVHVVAAVVHMVYRACMLVTRFFEPLEGKAYHFTARLQRAGKDLLQIAFAPLAVMALELSALYGLVAPYNGRKLYASIERATYGSSLLAPCFQPEATEHLFGGSCLCQNAF